MTSPDERVRDALLQWRKTKCDSDRRIFIGEIVRTITPPFDAQFLPGKTGHQLQASSGKWYTIAQYVEAPTEQFPNRVRMIVVHSRTKNPADPKWTEKRGVRLVAFANTVNDVQEYLLDSMVGYRPTNPQSESVIKQAVKRLEFRPESNPALNPGWSGMTYSARDYRDLLT